MYWLQRPPYLRRAAAAALVLAAFVWDVRTAATAPYHVAATAIAAGTAIDDTAVSWVDLPAGVLVVPDLRGAVAASDIRAGEPLTPALLVGDVSAPDGWWMVPIAVGTLAAPGDEALLVVADPPISVIGRVLERQVGDPYDLDHRPASIAVPGDMAPLIAAAEHQGLLITAIRPPTGGR